MSRENVLEMIDREMRADDQKNQQRFEAQAKATQQLRDELTTCKSELAAARRTNAALLAASDYTAIRAAEAALVLCSLNPQIADRLGIAFDGSGHQIQEMYLRSRGWRRESAGWAFGAGGPIPTLSALQAAVIEDARPIIPTLRLRLREANSAAVFQESKLEPIGT